MIFFLWVCCCFFVLGEVSQLLLSLNLENWLELANSRTLPVNVGQIIFYFFPPLSRDSEEGFNTPVLQGGIVYGKQHRAFVL